MRRKLRVKKAVNPDFLYGSTLVEKFINYLMKKGEKALARKIMYSTLEEIKKKTKAENPVEVLEKAISNASPLLEVRSRRVGGANYQVPREVRPERRIALACRWILEGVRAKKGLPTFQKLAEELMAASKNEGAAVKKKENVHKMAEGNKAFAHFAW